MGFPVWKISDRIFYRLKSLGSIDRKFRGHGKNDGFVLYEYIIHVQFRHVNHSEISDQSDCF